MVRQDRVMRKYCYVFTLNAICQHKVQRMKTKVGRFVNVLSRFRALFLSRSKTDTFTFRTSMTDDRNSLISPPPKTNTGIHNYADKHQGGPGGTLQLTLIYFKMC
ncbi:hypothetical protein ATANTOWER_030743 [Ataeniobius toweri]|uniref:Uncharacterized protein n=1 Tax=Ataeniobius toweri TaxID=208326 RepID=A0ABU7BA04_9TELE|nr:hypothetical protein [Ataeniobius toweri]